MRGRVKLERPLLPQRHNLSLTGGPGDDTPALRGFAFRSAGDRSHAP